MKSPSNLKFITTWVYLAKVCLSFYLKKKKKVSIFSKIKCTQGKGFPYLRVKTTDLLM